MTSPAVSICIPCHNAAPYVADAVGSVLGQTYRDLEVIVVDDASTDQSREVLAGIHDDRLTVLHRSYGNAAATRNEAFRNSSGKWIKFFDADDLISPRLIERQIQRLGNDADAVATCEWGRFYNDDPGTYTSNPETVWCDLPAVEWLVMAWSKARPMMQPGLFLIPRPVIEAAGLWNESLSLIDDFEFFARILTNTQEVRFTRGERLLYRSGLGDSLSQRKSSGAVESAATSLLHGTSHLLSRRNDEPAKAACANLLQDFVHTCYPDHQQIRKAMEKRILELGGSDLSPDGPPNFQRLRRVTGWKLARRIQKLAGR